MADGRPWPCISVAIPTYNQGSFIEETLRSILLQAYPAIELIVMDGGSTDNTVERLKQYSPWISHWVSEKDKGQSNAINKGYRRATGDLVAWQNSDDFYYANTFRRAAEVLGPAEQLDIVYGRSVMLDPAGKFLRNNEESAFDLEKMLPWLNLHNQAMFIRRRVFDAGHFIDESFDHCMDVDFFFRLAANGYQFQFIPELFAGLREHPAAKGSRQQDVAAKEFRCVYASVAANAVFPAAVRRKAVRSLQMWAHANFERGHMDFFRRDIAALRELGGFSNLTASLAVKWLRSVFRS